MDKDIFLDITPINISQENELPASIQSIDLLDAIESKDYKLVSQYLKTNPLPKTLKGKRIGEIAFENFDEKIMNELVEGGMQFVYIDSLSKVAVSNGVQAVKYYVEKVVEVGGRGLNYSQYISVLNIAYENSDADTLNYMMERQDGAGFMSPRHYHIILNLAMNEKNNELFENTIKTYMKNKVNKDGWGFNIKGWILGSKFSFDNLLFLQSIYNKSDKVKNFLNNQFPLKASLLTKKNNILNFLDTQEINDIYVYDKTHGFELSGIELNDMIEVLIARSHPAIHEMIKKDEYKKIVMNKFKNKFILAEFINNSNSDEIKKAFKYIPEMKSWTDDKKNNIAHYCLAIHDTQAIASVIYSVDKNLLIEENKNGKTPLSFGSQKIKTKMESQLINRTLFDNKVGKRQVKKRDNQKKRVM